MKRLLLLFIRFYQLFVSPCLGEGLCRFAPSCSHYAHEAISKHGAIKGGFLALKRLLKCGPWHPGGVDTLD